MTEVQHSADGLNLDEVFKALASEHRRKILHILSDTAADPEKTCCDEDEVCGCKLSETLGLAPSTISHHMAVLRASGLVDGRKEGLRTYFTIKKEALEHAASELRGF